MANNGDTHNSISGTVNGSITQVGTINVNGGSASTPSAHDEDEWVRLVDKSGVWSRVVTTHPHGDLHAMAVSAARRLAHLRDEALTDDDPWQDLDLARRFGERIDWLINHDKIKADLHSAEAVLLALAPLMHQCLWLRAAAKYRVVGPTDFVPHLDVDDLRESYEGYLRNHDKLVVRASLPALPDRDSARHEIGWWLFHRWLRQRAELLQPAEVNDLLTEVSDPKLRQVLTTRWVRDLLYGLRVDSRWLTDERRVSARDAVETVFGGTSQDQPLRKHLVALLLGMAHMSAIEVTDLSDVLIWHLGIPKPVHVDTLFETVRRATWRKRDDGPVLEASCDHEAVVEALQAHASRLGDLLRDVRLVTRFRGLETLGEFPTRATGDLVTPREDEHGNPTFSGWSKFRIDEDRIRDVLMGEQLYQDRRMAIRELYQNALDACRYRQARETYGERLGRPSHWSGEIRFFQGVDDDGRHYLDCVDNGIGMGIPELTGVFAQAGVRFAQLPEFREEQLDWRAVDPPVELYPNSRFGIGVLSYFMLADEIEVTTCRAGRDGGPTGPSLQVTVSGPGQLFQICETTDHRRPGTAVRLYLREPDPEGTYIRWLEEVLAIADFSTTSEHNGRIRQWEPGALARGSDSLVPWQFGDVLPTEPRLVFWCEKNGALLVDGLRVAPSTSRGVVGDQPSSSEAPRGYVANLTGPMSPRLSVDRTRILDDVADQVERLLIAALPRLLSHGKAMVTVGWLTSVAGRSLRLADLITKALIESGGSLPSPGREVDVATSGWTGLDLLLVEGDGQEVFATEHNSGQLMRGGGPEDHVLLWRLLAHAPNARLALVQEAVPDLVFPAVDVRAMPSDRYLITDGFNRWRSTDKAMSMGTILEIAAEADTGPRAVSSRARHLGFTELVPDLFPEELPSSSDLAVLSLTLNGRGPWLRHDRPVPVGHFRSARRVLGLSPEDVAEILDRYGLDASAARGIENEQERPKAQPVGSELMAPPLDVRSTTSSAQVEWELLVRADTRPHYLVRASEELGLSLAEVVSRMARRGLRVPTTLPDRAQDGDRELLRSAASYGEPTPIGHLLTVSSSLGISLAEAITRVAAYGVPTTTTTPPPADAVDAPLLSKDLSGRHDWLPPDRPVPAAHVVEAFVRLGVPIGRGIERLTAYGYDVSGDFNEEALEQADLRMLKNGGFDSPLRHYNRAITLDHLLRMSQASGKSLHEVADHLRDLGLDVADVADTIRAAVLKLPRPSQTPPQVVQTNIG